MIYTRAPYVISYEWKGLMCCRYCGAIEPEEHWDDMGLEGGYMQCQLCLTVSQPMPVVPAEEWFQPPTEKQGELFA